MLVGEGLRGGKGVGWEKKILGQFVGRQISNLNSALKEALKQAGLSDWQVKGREVHIPASKRGKHVWPVLIHDKKPNTGRYDFSLDSEYNNKLKRTVYFLKKTEGISQYLREKQELE